MSGYRLRRLVWSAGCLPASVPRVAMYKRFFYSAATVGRVFLAAPLYFFSRLFVRCGTPGDEAKVIVKYASQKGVSDRAAPPSRTRVC